MSARKKRGSKSIQTASKKYISDTKRQLYELSPTLNEMKAITANFIGKPQGNSSSKANSGQEAPVSGDAGNYLGGCTPKHIKAWLATSLYLELFGLMIFIKFYLLARLGGHKPARVRITKNIQIKQVVSSVWRKMRKTRYLSSSRLLQNSERAYHGRIELGSHTDTTVLGHNYVILTYTGTDCEVSPCSEEYESIQHAPVVNGVIDWTCPQSGDTFIPIFKEALWIGERLYHTLVNPNQMRHHQIDVQDNLCTQKPMGITYPEEALTVPLYM